MNPVRTISQTYCCKFTIKIKNIEKPIIAKIEIPPKHLKVPFSHLFIIMNEIAKNTGKRLNTITSANANSIL